MFKRSFLISVIFLTCLFSTIAYASFFGGGSFGGFFGASTSVNDAASILGDDLHAWYTAEATYITDDSGVEYWVARNDPSNTDLRLDKLATDGKRPTYTSANADANALPTVDFLTASDEQMDAQPNFGDPSGDKASIVLALSIDDLATNSIFQWSNGGASLSGISLQAVAGNRLRLRISDGSVTFIDYTVEAGVLDDFVIVSIVYDGNAGHARMFIDGVQKGGDLSCGTLNNVLTAFYLMGTPGQTTIYTGTGDVGEVIVTKTDIQADGYHTDLVNHLKTKWGVD